MTFLVTKANAPGSNKYLKQQRDRLLIINLHTFLYIDK